MSRSTFSILPYINRQKVKADGTANILCRITVDGKSAAISTGISCTPQEWNAKKGEVRNARDNGRLASFLAEVKDKYNSLLTTNAIITVEMLKAVLKDKDTTGRFLLNFGDTIVEWYRTSKARQTFLHKRTWQKNLRAFVHSLDKDDIAFEDIDECLYLLLRDSLVYLQSRGLPVDPATEKTYHYYKKYLRKKEEESL